MPSRTVRTAPHASLEALLAASSRGDIDSFANLYEAVAPRIYGVAVRILRDEHQAEEVTQEVLLQGGPLPASTPSAGPLWRG